ERYRPTGERHFNFILNVLDGDSVTRRSLAIDVDLHVSFAHNRCSDHVSCPIDWLQRGFNLFTHTVDGIEVGPEYFHADIRTHTCGKHFDPVDDRLREDIAPPRHLHHAAHLVIHEIAFRPRLPRPEEDIVLKRLLQFLAQLNEWPKR